MTENTLEAHKWASKGSLRQRGQRTYVLCFLRLIKSDEYNERAQGIEELWKFQTLLWDLEVELRAKDSACPMEVLLELIENYDASDKIVEEIDHLAMVLENFRDHYQEEASQAQTTKGKELIAKIETLLPDLRYEQVRAGHRRLAQGEVNTWLTMLDSAEAQELNSILYEALENRFNRFIRMQAAQFIVEQIDRLEFDENAALSFCHSIQEVRSFREEQEVTWLIAALTVSDSYLEAKLSDSARKELRRLTLKLAEGREEESIQAILKTVKETNWKETK